MHRRVRLVLTGARLRENPEPLPRSHRECTADLFVAGIDRRGIIFVTGELRDGDGVPRPSPARVLRRRLRELVARGQSDDDDVRTHGEPIEPTLQLIGRLRQNETGSRRLTDQKGAMEAVNQNGARSVELRVWHDGPCERPGCRHGAADQMNAGDGEESAGGGPPILTASANDAVEGHGGGMIVRR